ncbi:MAG: DNA repair protein RecN [Actinomycetota bacterium]|nr:DNA repair protein RecN [Actinomycetota bacterium]
MRVTELGVIADLGLLLGPGMIALTGETGTGKTLVVEAIELLLGGRADPVLVRPGAEEATIEGRFTWADDVEDLVLTRTVPVSGRSRAYVNGRMSPLSALDHAAGALIDLHGQHSHQSLLAPAAQRSGLDAFAHIDLEPIVSARRRHRDAVESLARLGGDAASRAREQDMLAFQVGEIDAANLASPDEDDELAAEEERLANARAHRDAAHEAVAALSADGGVTDALGGAVALMAGHQPLSRIHERVQAVAIDLADAATDLRTLAESLEDDPDRLTWVRDRRLLLRQLRRKYGETLADVIAYSQSAAHRLAELDSFEQRAMQLEQERDQAARDLAEAEAAVGGRRRAAAPGLAEAIERQLRSLAMPKARIEVRVGEDQAGDDVTWLLGANPGEPVLPLAKVASGGELARAMLAVRLVLSGAGTGPPTGREAGPATGREGGPATGREAGPAAGREADGGATTLVFDEVDAGIGGEAALAVGRALADLSRHHQVLVVTHLPQVAAFAAKQIAVRKEEVDGRTVATARPLDQTERIVELSRMLSGQPDSATARRHAEELLALAHRSQRDTSDRARHPGSPLKS